GVESEAEVESEAALESKVGTDGVGPEIKVPTTPPKPPVRTSPPVARSSATPLDIALPGETSSSSSWNLFPRSVSKTPTLVLEDDDIKLESEDESEIGTDTVKLETTVPTLPPKFPARDKISHRRLTFPTPMPPVTLDERGVPITEESTNEHDDAFGSVDLSEYTNGIVETLPLSEKKESLEPSILGDLGKRIAPVLKERLPVLSGVVDRIFSTKIKQ
ncbi:MAG: hypothetical protein HYZ48_01645, partial [Chlamydiales bacterium]|nr:hypothetical protein [Chlamydiales bacterium]